MVTAEVWGSEAYEVEVEYEDGDLSLFCSCPYFESDGPCKHLWATVLAAEARGYLSKVDKVRRVIGIYDDDMEDEFDDDFMVPRRLLTVPKAAEPPAPKPPIW